MQLYRVFTVYQTNVNLTSYNRSITNTVTTSSDMEIAVSSNGHMPLGSVHSVDEELEKPAPEPDVVSIVSHASALHGNYRLHRIFISNFTHNVHIEISILAGVNVQRQSAPL